MRPSDRTLRRWLRTGRPRRVERLIDRRDIAERLDALTALGDEDTEALRHVWEPVDGFEDRVVTGVRRQLDSEIVGLLFELGSLGWHTAASLLEPEIEPNED